MILEPDSVYLWKVPQGVHVGSSLNIKQLKVDKIAN